MKNVIIKKSTNPQKKLMATFYNNNNKIKTIHFGAAGMSDFTKHKDTFRKQRYLNRHKNNENWNNPMTAGALSRWILWNKPSLKASIDDYKKRFKFNKKNLRTKKISRKVRRNRRSLSRRRKN